MQLQHPRRQDRQTWSVITPDKHILCASEGIAWHTFLRCNQATLMHGDVAVAERKPMIGDTNV